MLIHEEITERIIGGAIEVHRILGPALLESAYEECLCHELTLRGLSFRRQVELPVLDRGVKLDCGYRPDLGIEECVILEIKSAEQLTGIHQAQLLTYMKLMQIPVGLINFNVPVLARGIIRIALTEVLRASASPF